ncbi:hypothetical protein TD95_000461 [Thielaviopsis punctulata]|uniref:Uncharacterized protein n=1 Tax=Thielaviopsis punctulata TaxID=72032 RepID=A0A0F4ZIZ7_9PEZI|nr:hypothetical protein TD95_000461 [Thielaviopsis punctulata]
MFQIDLSKNDLNVLEKIKDPESDPSRIVNVDPLLPKDPHVTDPDIYQQVSATERDTVMAIQEVELQIAGLKPSVYQDPIDGYWNCIKVLDALIEEHPNYASARNNRAQAYRRLFGDSMLVGTAVDSMRLIKDPSPEAITKAIDVVLSDLDIAISLLTPKTPSMPISPTNKKTLSAVHTQRATIYHGTAKFMAKYPLVLGQQRREAAWSKLDFETAASQDFAMGGRYGNEVAKGLAVSLNPTAKLCGEMVREAMKKEYSPAFGA